MLNVFNFRWSYWMWSMVEFSQGKFNINPAYFYTWTSIAPAEPSLGKLLLRMKGKYSLEIIKMTTSLTPRYKS
jgi:hypothetical protein